MQLSRHIIIKNKMFKHPAKLNMLAECGSRLSQGCLSRSPNSVKNRCQSYARPDLVVLIEATS